MGDVFFGIPKDLVRELAAIRGFKTAIETGTYEGKTAVFLRKYVPTVISIELAEELHEAAKARHADVEGVEFLLGPSPELLSQLVPRVDGPVLYWLDAHWCEDATGGHEEQCPLLDEISAIDSADASADACILIDDARFFLGRPHPPYRPEDWPPFIDVVDALRARFERFVTVLDDVIISGPADIRPAVDNYWLTRQWDSIRADRRAARSKVEKLERTSIGGIAERVLRAGRRRLG